MRLRDLITTPPELCGAHITIAQAAKEMMSAGVGSMGVLDEGRFRGIVTERDVLEAVARGFDVESEPVRCCMTQSPDVFDPDTDVYRAATFLLETGYRHLPVFEEELIAILSIRDVLVGIVDPGRIVDS